MAYLWYFALSLQNTSSYILYYERILPTHAAVCIALQKYVCWAVLLNILSAIFNVFSFSLLIPILNILFKTNAQEKVYQYMDWEWSVDSLKETAINNFTIM